MSEGPEKCKKRFKGIENFLRRVAFNLGNTPSQTEVKIISCIPIDVTDLQQKIIQLERQLAEKQGQTVATGPAPPPETAKKVRQASVHTAIGAPRFSGEPKTINSYKRVNYISSHSYGDSMNQKRSIVSFVFPTSSKCNPEYITVSGQLNANELFKDCGYKQTEGRKNISPKKKRPLNKKKIKPQLVYYSQTDTNPFNKYVPSLNSVQDNEILSRSYLSSMVRKQYKHISHFTAPICRDTDPDDNCLHSYESDMCSCCHGAFHNIDTHMTNKTNLPTPFINSTVNEDNTRNAYYDSSLYDLVPVKEKPCKINKRDPDSKRNVKKLPRNTKYCPDYVRSKSKYGFHPPTVNYHTMSSNYIRKRQMKMHHRRDAARKQTYKNKYDHENSTGTSKSCCVDLGDIYVKPIKTKTQPPKKIEPVLKNAECLTTSVPKIECQTSTSKTIDVKPTPREDKTEVTLNQIKNILQSVLTEVKTNSQVKPVTETRDKKDAVVQKGVSQSKMQGASSILDNLSYSPYNINPYMASCSRNIPSNQYFYNGYNEVQQPKGMQNYPLYIPTQGRPVCASCYRNSTHIAKPGHPQYATTTATNTEGICGGQSTETEKLIKEIYKSMAFTMDVVAKDTSQSVYDETPTIRDCSDKSINKPNNQRMIRVPEAVSELMRKKDIQISQFAPQINSKFKSKTSSSPTSTPSQDISTDTVERNYRAGKEMIMKFHNNKELFQTTETECDAQNLQQTSTTTRRTSISENETETTSSESDSEDTYVQAKTTSKNKSEKKGIFSKFKSVFQSKEKKKKTENEAAESDVSDSDDYQTIYSQKVTRTPRRVSTTPRKIKPHSKVINSKQFYQKERKPEKSKRTPYMEQEYRRYWNEKLMFHENQKRKYSSEQPYSRESNPGLRTRPEYHRNYEARSVLVEPRRPMCHTKLDAINARNPSQSRMDRQQQMFAPTSTNTVARGTGKGLTWLKKHKMGIHCGEKWKKILLEG